jgi:molybdopterin/thiamine biosynthesis adenylyltransferase
MQDKDASFYRQFQLIVLGLDSIEGNLIINAICHSITFD